MSAGTLGVIGYGNMGSAIVNGLVASNRYMPSDIHIFDVDARKRSEAKSSGHFVHTTPEALGAASGIVLLAVKPKDILGTAKKLSECPGIDLVISIAAGVSTAKIESGLGQKPVIRAMPNAPCLVSAGAIVVARGAYATDADAKEATGILGAIGTVLELPENLMDAVTGLSGSGPAYVALMIEAMADGGVRMGLPRADALSLAVQTVFGTASMLRDGGMHPGQLKELVASPGGTTIEGIAALEAGGFRSAIIEAITAATRRSKDLGA